MVFVRISAEAVAIGGWEQARSLLLNKEGVNESVKNSPLKKSVN